ncbi:beta-microseminoprotein-like [Salminus brasiliensis]|uniref:beta-microseminoprotein-like n=1 Tax=Salminus brasiliensis TaxID=930266 RepID=UPI003B8343FE
MRSAVLVLGLCALFPLVLGDCFRSLLDQGATQCKDDTDQTMHDIGSSWRNSKCVECACSANGLRCCDSLPSVSGYPEDCVVEFDYEKCTFAVIKKNDRSVECDFDAVL